MHSARFLFLYYQNIDTEIDPDVKEHARLKRFSIPNRTLSVDMQQLLGIVITSLFRVRWKKNMYFPDNYYTFTTGIKSAQYKTGVMVMGYL